MPDGYDSYLVYQYSSYYCLLYFNDADVSNFSLTAGSTAKLYTTTEYRSFYKFDTMADLLSWLRFNSSTCDVSALLSDYRTTSNDYLMIKTGGPILTNSSSMKTLLSNAGYAPDESYYAYFHNVDSKHYVLCFVTISGADSPIAVFANNIPAYDSSTKKLTCPNGTMYGFYADTLDDCINFLKNEDGSKLTKIEKGVQLLNVTSFVASSCDIMDTSTGLVYFHAKDLDGNDIGDMNVSDLNPDDLAVKDHLEPGMISRLLGVANDIIQGITAIPLLFGWLPSGFSIAINSILVIFVVLLIVLIVLKIIHG